MSAFYGTVFCRGCGINPTASLCTSGSRGYAPGAPNGRRPLIFNATSASSGPLVVLFLVFILFILSCIHRKVE